MHNSDLQEIGLTDEFAIAELIGLCSEALEKPVIESTIIPGIIAVEGGTSSL